MWILGASVGRLQVSGLLVTVTAVAAAAKITPTTAQTKTAALLSPLPAQSPVQLACKKVACDENLDIETKATNCFILQGCLQLSL